MLSTVFFDLDGTLLPMDQDAFTKDYFKRLAGKLAPLGYEPERLVKSVWAGTAAMVKNNGERTNEEAFWQCFLGLYGESCRKDKPAFDEFYEKEFQGAKAACGFNPQAAQTVEAMKAMGLRLVLATNPIFPAVATESRIRWAGLRPEDFLLYTTYENSRFCKPNPAYYQALLDQLGLAAEECLMVGNDAEEDTAAQETGMPVFLLTDCLINRKGRDLSPYPQGGFSQLLEFVKASRQG